MGRSIHSPLVGCLVFLPALIATAEQPVRFNRDIRPLLADKCFRCHGPDANHREAELRLDEEADAKAKRETGHVIYPGRPDESSLLERVTSEDDDLRMPPPDAGEPLNAAEVKLLKRWIAAGAKYEKHWSFAEVGRPEPPAVKNEAWIRNPLDRFILARLEQQQWTPSPVADRVTLARRLWFDLAGLPPLPEEIRDYVTARNEAKAYEQLVDRLLAGPHFGERMAMYWLDLVRYADTVGYHGDQEHHASPYRDYVIDAFNTNKPFDQFTIEQLAGDLLETPGEEQRIATAYNRLLQTTHEGGAQDKEYRTKYAADRVRNVSAVWLGATMGCTECHDHKYDPYQQRDFYQLAAFFADINERGAYRGASRPPEIDVLSASDRRLRAKLDDVIERQTTELSNLKEQPESPERKQQLEELEAKLADSKSKLAEVLKRKAPRHGDRRR